MPSKPSTVSWAKHKLYWIQIIPIFPSQIFPIIPPGLNVCPIQFPAFPDRPVISPWLLFYLKKIWLALLCIPRRPNLLFNVVWENNYDCTLSFVSTTEVDSCWAGSVFDLNILLLKSSKLITPVEMEASEILKTGRKNSKCCPPQIGNQDGSIVSIIGKYNMSTTLPNRNGA